MENAQNHITRLRARIVTLEIELARYAAKYGLTDMARELLKREIE